MAKTFFIPNKESILGQQEILTAKSILALVEAWSHTVMMRFISVSPSIVSSISSVEL